MALQKVKALFDYAGKHTDELNFRKGDIITVTQPAEDGWLEGTLKGVTGWFPGNYVTEYSAESLDHFTAPASSSQLKIFSNIIETEAEFIKELDSFLNSSLQPVWRLFGEDYDLINRNLETILEAHRQLLSGLRSENEQTPIKFGRIFLTVFPRLKGVHSNYCALHPRIIKLLMDNSSLKNNNANINILNLTIGLSSPFKRIAKYETLLEELTRFTPENHPDRGDCQRSCSLFKELVIDMNNLRKQKDVEAEIMNANIKNWEGPPISKLGTVRLTCPVRAQWAGGLKDFYLIAFDSAILLVSLSNSSEFQLDFKFPLDRTTISSTEKPAHSLDMQSQNYKLLVTFHSADDFEKIRSRVDVYSTVQKRSSSKSIDSGRRSNGSRPSTPDNREPKSLTARFSRPTSPAPPPPPPTFFKSSLYNNNNLIVNNNHFNQPQSHLNSAQIALMVSRIRGVLPHRRAKIPLQKEPVPCLKRGSSARKNKKDLPTPVIFEESQTNPSHYERDLQILKVVESFANLSKKPTIPLVGSTYRASTIGLSSLPSVRVSTITSHSGSPMDVEASLNSRPKSISPIATVAQTTDPIGLIRTLQNDVGLLKEQMARLQADLNEERRQRKALQEQVNCLNNSR